MNQKLADKNSLQTPKFISSREASLLFPMLGRDYITRLLRDGTLYGTRSVKGHWQVSVESLQTFAEFLKLEETVRNERVRFERQQEQVEVKPESVSSSPVSILFFNHTQALLVYASGCLLGFLFFMGLLSGQSVVSWPQIFLAAVSFEGQTASVITSQHRVTFSEHHFISAVEETSRLMESGEGIILFKSDFNTEGRVNPSEIFSDEVTITPVSQAQGIISFSDGLGESFSYVVIPATKTDL